MMRLTTYFLLFVVPSALAGKGASRDVRVINNAGFKVLIYWINRWKNDELQLNSPDGVFHGSETIIKSFITHEFEVVEVPAKKTGLCKGENNECRKGYFQVNEYDGQLVRFTTNLTTIVHTDSKSKAQDQAAEVLKECKAQIVATNSTLSTDSFHKLLTCINESVNASMAKKQEEIDFQETVRLRLGNKLINYACVDPKMKQTTEIENRTWTFPEERMSNQVKVMMDRPNVQIHLILDFISDKECAAVEKAVKLERIDGANGLWASKGGVTIPQTPMSPLLVLARRFYGYARDQLNGISLEASTSLNSEQFFVLKYSGKGADAESLDRYEPHCDGACNGEEHKKGDRVATVIAYCEAPLVGGSTHFNNAGIHIKPQKGSAIYYSYVDPLTLKADTGFTQHSGCPVIEGDKTIVTHKIRY